MEIKNNKKNNSVYEIILLKDILFNEKYLSDIYNKCINDFSNSELSNEFVSLLNNLNNIINKIKDLLFSLGYSSFSISNENEINKLIYEYSSRKM